MMRQSALDLDGGGQPHSPGAALSSGTSDQGCCCSFSVEAEDGSQYAVRSGLLLSMDHTEYAC